MKHGKTLFRESMAPPSTKLSNMDGVIFDGDDTLWVVEPLYDEARKNAAAVAASANLDPVQWERLQRQIDLELVETMGLTITRFPLSNVEAYRRLATREGHDIKEEVAEQIASEAKKVFMAPAPLVQGAQEVLGDLSIDHKLALVTRGDTKVQEQRIRHSGLADFFDSIEVVENKTPDVFVRTTRHIGTAPARCWSVGNSLPSDIHPALEAGLRTIWIEAHVWEYEKRFVAAPAGHVIHANSLFDVPTIIRLQDSAIEA